MHIILSASGHIGSQVVRTLLDAGEQVTAVLHTEEPADHWQRQGAKIAIADVRNSDQLRHIFSAGTRAFLLNPPADVATDIDVEERATARSIVDALQDTGIEKVVAASTYGAQPSPSCGDLGSLYDFEQALKAQPIPAAIQRGAYYMTNWDAQLDEAKSGTLTTMLPAETKIPMVAPADLGKAAALRLIEPRADRDIHFVEGPERYSPQDVADAFGKALGHEVRVIATPREEWVASYRKLGFSEAAAASFTRMMEASVDGGFDLPGDYERGDTTLEAYIARLVEGDAR